MSRLRNYYTIRLTVDTTQGSQQAQTVVYLEPDLLTANWPRYVSAGPYTNSGMALATNPDGHTRMVLEGPRQGLRGAELYSISPDGSSLDKLDFNVGSYTQPAVGDVDGVPGDEVVMGDDFSVRVFYADGTSATLPTDFNVYFAINPCR